MSGKPVMDWRRQIPALVISLLLWALIIFAIRSCIAKPLYTPWFGVVSCPTYDAIKEIMMVGKFL